MDDPAGMDPDMSGITLNQVRSVWWAVVWRYVLIGVCASLVLTSAALLFSGGRSRSLLAVPEDSVVHIVAVTIASAAIMMVAMRQALLADYARFSLTVLEPGSDEPGRIHSALGPGRMLKIWWAAAWPLYLVGQGLNQLALRTGLLPDAETGARMDGMGMLVAITLLGVLAALSIACLWRALRKQYGDFRLVALLPWSARI
ncbi:MAG: hypothetical protein OES32_15360 [Acidobacteriota bacterium]|nr:hypothetical protein [Acidobacteriota bacterium]